MSDTITLNLDEVDKEIAAVLNKHGIDSKLNLPDFMLSRFMLQTLQPLIEITSVLTDAAMDMLDDVD